MNKIIVDSGSTKAHWKLCVNTYVVFELQSQGFNPFLQSQENMINALRKEVLPFLEDKYISEGGELFFYGAGCSNEKKVLEVSEILSRCFSQWKIVVDHDLTASARALFGKSEGIAAILGTGSNSCYYNGNTVVENIRSLGYILGDEATGSSIGKAFIKAYLHGGIPNEVAEKAENIPHLNLPEILDAVYVKPFPNRYLAGYTKFIKENIEYPFMEALVEKNFESFFDLYLCKYKQVKELGVSFVGSVAFHFEPQLQKVAKKKGIKIGRIISSPINALVKYHLERT